jgi:hypothetical protein
VVGCCKLNFFGILHGGLLLLNELSCGNTT